MKNKTLVRSKFVDICYRGRAVYHFDGVLQGMAGLVDSLIVIASLGFVTTSFELHVAMNRTMKRIERIKKERDEAKP